ncbi:MAG: ethylbenzene dehydrogenase-related protein [Nitrospinota bacterium]|nr:ethylbenzene dehydrogenase-related protein [Nitrospinota bacterium]
MLKLIRLASSIGKTKPCLKHQRPMQVLTIFLIWFALFPNPATGQVNLLIESRKIEKMIEDARTPQERAIIAHRKQEIFNRGKSNYHRFCAHCHGEGGKGDGEASYFLFPRPRDLSHGIFKFHSTQPNALPLDEDLFKTIKRGVPGTVMPAWREVLSDQAIGSIVIYLKNFSTRFNHETPDQKIEVGLETPFDPLSVEKGKKLYSDLRCRRCHDESGGRQGPLTERLKNTWGGVSFVYDLRRPSLYKAGRSAEEIHQTLSSGMNGTPMKAYNYLTDAERWHLIHYLQSLFPKAGANHSTVTGEIISHEIPVPINTEPDDPLWDTIPAVHVQLAPIVVKKKFIGTLKVQSVYNQKSIAFRLQWNDFLPNSVLTGAADFLDAIAIQFPLGRANNASEAPFFGMGEHNKPVNIWHWKADFNQDIGSKSVTQQTQKPSSSFLNPFRETPVEEINSRGFGSLNVQPLQNQQVSGKGKWENGQWTVILVRNLETPDNYDIKFRTDEPGLLAFAVWEGSNREKNANKSVSFWNHLVFK